MPFTFSHPAIVLPFKKVTGKFLSLTGLIVGSLTPDFEYFMRMKVQSIYSHSILGLFWFDLPLGIVLTFVYHLVVRDTLISNLPETLNRKLSEFKYFDWTAYFRQYWLAVIVSIFIGAASHIFWDAFTHPTGFFVRHISFLNQSVEIWKIQVRVFTILQHLSSFIGGSVVIWVVFNLKSKQRDQSSKKAIYWIWVTSISIIIFTIRFLTAQKQRQYGNIIVMFISAFLVSLFVISLKFFITRRNKQL
jgi:hypothetical protein